MTDRCYDGDPFDTAVQVRPQQALERPQTLLEVIAKAVADPRIDVDKMAKLLDLQERIVADERRTAFMEALGRLTPKLPAIGKRGVVSIPGREDRKYALLEDVDRAIRPILGEEGFSMSFDTEPVDGKIRVICKLSHKSGHFETKQIDLPPDNSGSKNGAQAIASTIAYGRRILTKMFFNLIEADADNDHDGNNPTKISQEQAKDLEAAIQEVKMDKGRFLVYMHVGDVRDILVKDLPVALNAIDVKRRGVK